MSDPAVEASQRACSAYDIDHPRRCLETAAREALKPIRELYNEWNAAPFLPPQAGWQLLEALAPLIFSTEEVDRMKTNHPRRHQTFRTETQSQATENGGGEVNWAIRPIASVYAQEDLEGRWTWWITSLGNNATLAKSARKYSTKRAALKAAQKVASLGTLEIDWRNQ